MQLKKKIAIGIICIILLSSLAAGLEVPNEERTCYIWGTQIFMCFVSADGSYAKWFTGYQPMHDYYTPQLKEIAVTGGSTETFTAKVKTQQATISITGSPSYLYVKHV